MQTLLKNPSQPLIPPKKLFISTSLNLKRSSIPLIKKRAPKYTKHTTIIRDDFRTRDLTQLKTVSSFTFDKKYSSNKFKLNRSPIYKTIKFYKKYIQYFKGTPITLRLAKQLPRLSEYEMEYSNSRSSEKYKILAYLQSLKKIFFNLRFEPFDSEKKPIVSVLQENRSRFLRTLSRTRSISKLDMEFTEPSSDSLFPFLWIFGSCPLFLSHLKHFSIRIRTGEPLNSEQDIHGDERVKMALGYVTHLSLPDDEWFDLLYNHEILKNLTCLHAEIWARNISEVTQRKLASLVFSTKLKILDLGFQSSYKHMEKAFIESFTLPKSIESVELKLRNFIWKDEKLELTKSNRKKIEDSFKTHPRFRRFYHQWVGLDKLKALKLTIDDHSLGRGCPTLALSFAKGIFRQVKNLKEIRYKHASDFDIGSKNANSNKLPMDLKVFWECIEGSKDTLEDLEIKVEKVNFFAQKDVKTMRLQNLRSLKIVGDIYCDVIFGDFLNGFSQGRDSVVKVCLKSLCFKEEKQVIDLFKNMAYIPRNLEVELNLGVLGRTNQSGWKICANISQESE